MAKMREIEGFSVDVGGGVVIGLCSDRERKKC